MSLLPARFQPEALPTLGALVREAIAPKADPIKAFEALDCGYIPDPIGGGVVGFRFIAEKDCRQIKSEVKKRALKDLEQEVFEQWLYRVRPSGDVESVQSQWEASAEFEEFCDEHDPQPAPPTPSEEGWIEWKGGANPLPRDVRCRVRLEDGQESSLGPCHSYVWAWDSRHVTAYKVVA